MRLQNLRVLNQPEQEALRQATLILCSKDIVYWVNNFGWTFDPRLKISYIPMILYPKQAEFLLFLEGCEENEWDAIVEKSRDMGVTWLCCFFLVHRWLFKQGFKGAIGSRKEDLVDKSGDPDSIFEKIRALIVRLPYWMLPPGFNPRVHDKHMTLINPQNLSVITGESGDNMGRGGRNGPYFVDEAAFVEHPETVDAAINFNASYRIYVSTPNGMGNSFARKREAAIKDPDGPIKLFTFHWKDDPRKNAFEVVQVDGEMSLIYPWYEKVKKVINNPVLVAQEVDIDYSASIEGIVILAKYVEAAIGFAEWLWRTKKLSLPNKDHDAGYDVAEEGDNENVLWFRRGWVVYDCVNWSNIDTYKSSVKVVKVCNLRKLDVLNYDSVGVGTGVSGNFKSAGLGLRFLFRGINGGAGASSDKWVDGVNADGTIRFKKAKDKFYNFRAEIWWLARTRFEKTYEYRVLGVEHPLEELISVPDHPMLKAQLSSVLCWTTTGGKIQIESKKDMRDRGVKSPDYADALIYCLVKRRNRSERTGTYHSQSNYE